jgi:predicted dinucleotide-binding enzyme
MKIGVLGTGTVGETIADRLVELGYEVKMGSRSASNEKALAWAEKSGGSVGTFADAAAFGDILFVATKGETAVDALRSAEVESLRGKTIIDISNPLDFSNGMPPSLSISNTDSLGEQLQREFPEANIVKSLNTMWCGIMVNPNLVANGDHDVFMSGNNADAKAQTRQILQGFGWEEAHIIDLGDITTARATEMMLPIWLRLYMASGSAAFNFKIAR